METTARSNIMKKHKQHYTTVSAGIFLCSVLALNGCSSIYMTAEDRFQETQEIGEEVELETIGDQTALAYREIPYRPYSLEDLARGLIGLSEEQIETYRVIDEHTQEWLTMDTPEQYADLSLTYGNTSFWYAGIQDGEQYQFAVRQFAAAEEYSFAKLAEQYPREELEGLSKEQAVTICETAVREAKISFAYETAIALDCDSLNRLQQQMCEEFGEANYMGAPGSSSGDIRQWTKDQEAYAVFFRMQLDGKTVDTKGYQCNLTLFCRTDQTIVYAYCIEPVLDSSAAAGEPQEVISSREAYAIGQEMLKQKGKQESRINSVTLNYSYGYATEKSRTLQPCWTVAYCTEVSGREIVDYLYIDAVTGLEAKADAFY